MTTTTTTTTPKYDALPGWFETFCGPDDRRYEFDRPWLHGDGSIYACDGRASVRVASGLVDPAGWPTPMEGSTKCDPRRLSMEAIYGLAPGDAWEDSPLALPAIEALPPALAICPECDGEPHKLRTVECDWCDGRGVLEDFYDDEDEACQECEGKGTWTERSCSYCSNTGRVPNMEAVAIPDRSDGLCLAATYVHRILDAGGAIHARRGGDAHKSALKFTVGEDFEGRLMPIYRG
jgi:hypothetical protein